VGLELRDHQTIEGDGAVRLECWELVTQWWSFVLQQTGDPVMERCDAANW